MKDLTKKKAKKHSIEKWKLKLIGISEKDDRFKRFRKYSCDCPLCELYGNLNGVVCGGCPLFVSGNDCGPGSIFDTATSSKNEKVRILATREIIRIIQEWKV